MSQTIVLQIGNTDNKLTQQGWSYFVKDLWAELESDAITVHFSGFSPGEVPWQNHCMVFNVDYQALGYDDFETYLNDLRFMLGKLARRYNQDSIALLVGETEFVPSNYETKEIFSGNSSEDGEEGSEEGDLSGEEGIELSIPIRRVELRLEKARQEGRGQEDKLTRGTQGLQGGSVSHP